MQTQPRPDVPAAHQETTAPPAPKAPPKKDDVREPKQPAVIPDADPSTCPGDGDGPETC